MLRAICFLLLTASFASAQEPSESIPGRWAPTGVMDRGAELGRRMFPMTAEQERALNVTFRRLDQIFRAADSLNPPAGVEVLLRAGVGFRPGSVLYGSPRATNAPIPVDVALLFFNLFRPCPSCPIERVGEAGSGLSLWINDLSAAFEPTEPNPASESETQFFLAPRLLGRTHGFDVWEGRHGRVILSPGTKPLYVPVTQEEFITRVLRDLRSRTGAAQSALRSAPSEQAAALADMESAIREVERVDPAAAAEMRRQVAEVRRQLAAANPRVGAEAREGLETTADLIAAVQRELTSLTPAQRQAPAYRAFGPSQRYRDSVISVMEEGNADTDLTVRPSGLVSAVSPVGRQVVRLNPEFFEPNRSPSAVQLIVLESWQGGDPTSVENASFELGQRRRLFGSLDWNALRNLVER